MEPTAYEWVPNPPTKRQRLISAVWLAAFLAVALNLIADWKLFYGYDQWVFGGLLITGVVLFERMPRSRLKEGRRHSLKYWIILVSILVGALAFSVFGHFG